MGYVDAGFNVVCVDCRVVPDNPGNDLFQPHVSFVQADAIAYLSRHGSEFDAIHASPPCQAHSALRHLHPQKSYECWIERTRQGLTKFAVPWVIENVPGSPLQNPVILCGSAFGLRVRRHRLFESNIALVGTECRHKEQGRPIDVSGTGGRRINRRRGDNGGNTNKPRNITEAREAIGIKWMSRYDISQAIPPAYTQHIGQQMLEKL